MCFQIFSIAQLAIVAWIVLQWIAALGRLSWGHPVRKVLDALNRVIDPVLRPIRRVLPPLRFGGAALDLSPIILLVGLQIIARFVCG